MPRCEASECHSLLLVVEELEAVEPRGERARAHVDVALRREGEWWWMRMESESEIGTLGHVMLFACGYFDVTPKWA